jgi:hypothetical protein
MVGRGSKLLAVLFACAVLAAACSSSDDSDGATADTGAPTDTSGETTDTGGATDPGPARGVTDDSINIAVVYGDTKPLEEAGLLPEFGDTEQDFQTFADQINADGGMGGRQVDLSFHSFAAGSSATDQHVSCVEATEDRETFIVIFPGGALDETVLCVTQQNQTLALQLAGAQPASVYEKSEGRFFNNAMSANRLFGIMVSELDERGELDGKTIGIVRPDQANGEEAAQILTDALSGAGYEVAEDVALPCEANSCSQNEVGVERLRSAGVDAVFSLLGPATYPAFVSAGGSTGYTPQWFSSDYENQVFETTAQFMESAKQWYDGAIGTTTAVEDPEPDELRTGCNEYFTEQTDIEYEVFTDAWRLVGNACEMMRRIDRVIDGIDDDGDELGQNTFIAAMEQEHVDNGAREGDFGPDKHDAYDVYALLRFDQSCTCWHEIEGTRATWDG